MKLRKEYVVIKLTENEVINKNLFDYFIKLGYSYKDGQYEMPESNKYIWVNFKADGWDWTGEVHFSNNKYYKYDYYFDANTELDKIYEFFKTEPEIPANGEYYTECDEEFYNKLMRHYGFSVCWNHGWEESYSAIGLDFNKKMILAADNNGIAFFKRHEDIRKETYISNENLINLLENNNKVKKTTMNKKIAIKVGDSQELSKMVQEFLFSKGFVWGDIGNKYKIADKYIGINHQEYKPNKLCYWSELYVKQEPEHKIYDAATQMGEIIALFNEPPVPEIIVENDSGEKYKAEFSPGYVKFGCAKIDNIAFSSLNSAMDTKISPDSKGITYIQIGRGKFSPNLIKQIVEHPHFGKGEKD